MFIWLIRTSYSENSSNFLQGKYLNFNKMLKWIMSMPSEVWLFIPPQKHLFQWWWEAQSHPHRYYFCQVLCIQFPLSPNPFLSLSDLALKKPTMNLSSLYIHKEYMSKLISYDDTKHWIVKWWWMNFNMMQQI